MIQFQIIEDHPVTQIGLKGLIAKEKNWQTVGQSFDGEKGWIDYQRLRPDVILLDVELPKVDGLTLAARIRRYNPQQSIVLLSKGITEERLHQALSLGIKGVLLKRNVLNEIRKCISEVIVGKEYVSTELRSAVYYNVRDSLKSKPDISCLSKTERRILGLIAEELTTEEIAAKLFNSPYTIRNHRRSICRKLNLQGGLRLVSFALRHRFLLMEV